MTGIELGLGSRPGSSDLLAWTDTSYGNGIETYINQSGIRDGQLVFASVQVSVNLLVWFPCYLDMCRYGMELD